jgi:methylated-DNA-protein-cysteine methyltransferase-like protein
LAKNNKHTSDKLPSILPSGRKESSFFEQVYEVARQIPEGRVTTYGAIAEFLGAKKSARMVGWAMNGAHNNTTPVPAQRVVNRNGMLSGKSHFASPTLMQELLEKEGIEIKNDTVIDFEKKFWNPNQLMIDNR